MFCCFQVFVERGEWEGYNNHVTIIKVEKRRILSESTNIILSVINSKYYYYYYGMVFPKTRKTLGESK